MPCTLHDKKKYGFLALRQRNMIVAAYEAKFHTLSRYATTQLLDTEKERIRLFMKGLKTNL